MSQINRVPQGLQDLLGSKNFGDNPSELGQVVAPVLDLTHFLAAERRSWYLSATAITITADGDFDNTLVVPDGEVWIVQSVGVVAGNQAVPTAAQHCTFGVGVDQVVNSPQPGIRHAVAGPWRFAPAQAINTSPVVFSVELNAFVVFSGERFTFSAADVSVSGPGSIYARATVRYTKLFV